MPKYKKYQDYVIRDGKFIGEFEQMYIDFEDPWNQSVIEENSLEKLSVLNYIKRLKCTRVLELGCGLGHYTKKIHDYGFDALGIDISETAVQKAKIKYPMCNFKVSDILNYDMYKQFNPEIIIMSEITWYVLDKLDTFLQFIKVNLPNVYIVHLLTTYPKGVQKYGNDKFTTLDEIMKYFDLNYLVWGEVNYNFMNGVKRTYFIGKERYSIL